LDVPLTLSALRLNLKLQEENSMPFIMQTRFISGQMFSSSLSICLAANMLYNRGLASIFRQMIRAPYIVVPMPVGSKCQTFGDLVKYFVRKRNMLPMALLRRNDVTTWEDEDLEDEIQKQAELARQQSITPGAEGGDGAGAGGAGGEGEEPKTLMLPPVSLENPFAALAQSALLNEDMIVDPAKLAEFREKYSKRMDGTFVPAKKWSPEDPHSLRYIYTAPSGDRFLDGGDGILVLLPTPGAVKLYP